MQHLGFFVQDHLLGTETMMQIREELVGLCAVLIAPVLHFGGKVIASTETIFVAEAHRAGAVGRKLLHAAEEVAVLAGAGGLYVTAPTGGRLERLLPHVGYHETNRIFFRGLL